MPKIIKQAKNVREALESNEAKIDKATNDIRAAIKLLELDEEVREIVLNRVFRVYAPSDKEIAKKVEAEVERVVGSRHLLSLVLKDLIKDVIKEVIGKLDYDIKNAAEKAIMSSIVSKISTDEFLDDIADYYESDY